MYIDTHKKGKTSKIFMTIALDYKIFLFSYFGLSLFLKFLYNEHIIIIIITLGSLNYMLHTRLNTPYELSNSQHFYSHFIMKKLILNTVR